MDSIPRFGFLCETFDHTIVFQVIIDLEMRCAVNLELEVFVSNLILAEILRLCILAKKQACQTGTAVSMNIF